MTDPTSDVDVVVLGTGASGLVAAIAAADAGARVALLEKGAAVGGTTALSGGVVWLPGVTPGDSTDDAITYLTALANGTADDEMVRTFVHQARPTVDWLHEHTPLRLALVERYPDYHPEHPGGRPGGGRSYEPELFATADLGPWADRLVGQVRRLLISEIPSGGGSGVIPDDVASERAQRGVEGLGRGLVAALLQGCLDRGIEPQLNARAVGLDVVDGRVRGVTVESAAGRVQIAADAVVLATGGFEFDAELVRDFLRGPISHPPGIATNTGDGLRLAMSAGAALGAMAHAWWVPVVLAEPEPGVSVPTLLLRERTLPGTLMLNSSGRRFANEAANYNALGAAFHAFDVTRFAYANDPAWLVVDDACVQKYGVFGLPPGQVPSWLRTAETVADLAALIGADEPTVQDTLTRWNRSVAAGVDSEFDRGHSRYDGWCGDQRHYGTPAATLGALGSGPFHVTRVYASALGTKGGPRTTTDGQVLAVDGTPIAGLYAAGNAMAAPTGMVYGGAGGTLGPALVFGRLAGAAAGSAVRASVATARP
ncbi:MAG TPA: FAD-dependent oxidoreductase [Jatrophihabitantaceae bacterium]|nr:FAD-dependent oxidoreductase [Jatrophihabitantaceae bacterium]